MDINKVEKLASILQANNLSVIEFQEDGDKIRIEKNYNQISPFKDNVFKETLLDFKNVENLIVESTPSNKKDASVVENNSVSLQGDFNEIKSPMVGVFYEAASPNSESFVKVGDKVKKGDTVCIIEAMKLMNEISSDFDGEVVEVLVKDGEVVDYSQTLFKVK